MKFKSIYIQNLGVYRSEKIDLGLDKSNLTFINGNNGRGKTTLINSLKWCLFRGPRPAVSEKAIHDLGVASPIEIRVEIEIEALDGTSLLLERSQLVTVLDDRVTETPIGQATLTGKLRIHGQPTRDIESAGQYVESWFPKKLENFILFDAEQLANFFNPETRVAIEAAVLQIAGVESLDLAINGLKDQLTKFDRELAKSGGKKAIDLQGDKEIVTEALATAERNIAESESNLESAETELKRITSELSRYELAMQQLDKIEGLRSKEENLHQDFKTSEARLNDQLIKDAYLFLLGSTLDSVDKFYDQGLAAGYPLAFPSESLREILDSDQCVCGCSLTSSGHRSKIVELIRKQEVAEGVDKALPQTKASALGLRTTISSKKTSALAQNKGLTTLHNSLTQVRSEIAEINGNAADGSEWAALLADERRQTAKKHSAQNALNLAKQAMTAAQSRLAIVDAEINKQMVASASTNRIKAIQQFLRGCIATATETRRLAIEQVRKDLESSMNYQYSNIKNGSYQVEITSRFDVHLRNGSTQAISEGEKMSLAYSFAIAIRQVLAMQFPLVVDSAFGRLDSTNRTWLANALVRLTSEDASRQAIFLMHDLEYTPETALAFKAAMPVELYLSHDSETKSTQVREGIDPDWLSSESSPWFNKQGTSNVI